MISTLVVLLATCNLLISRVYSLKLTPVQRTKHRLDIHEECEKFLSAVQNAHKKVLEDEMNVIDQRVTLDSDELKKLRLLVNRWNSIDDKLRDINALSASQNKVCELTFTHRAFLIDDRILSFISIEPNLRGYPLLLGDEQGHHRKAAGEERHPRPVAARTERLMQECVEIHIDLQEP